MQKDLLYEAAQFHKEHRRKKAWQKVFLTLAVVVVFCTTYALILPAITMEPETFCGIEAHVHEAACYQEETVLSCQTEEGSNGHSHSDECYELQNVLTCTQEETEGHTHSDACYGEPAVLICAREETEGHAHTEACMDEAGNVICGQEEQEGHTHTDSCYDKGEPVCGLEESESHIHSEVCSVAEQVLICTQEKKSVHVHTEQCYETSQVLTCQKEEHTHCLACYSDPSADVEEASSWESAIEKLERTGEWAADALTIAKSQLGYTESAKNYIVLEDGETIKGYTCYGDWYGSPYGDWCAMFVSFCLNFAGVEGMPLEASCPGWVEALAAESCNLYRAAGEYEPQPGDVIFFDLDNDGSADHVGLVEELIAATEEASVQLKTIEGNKNDQVQNVTYPLDDATILGYGDVHTAQENDAVRSEAVKMATTLIDEMPSADEIDAKLAEFGADGDDEGEETYYLEVSQQVAKAYYYYAQLTDAEKALVTNADKLLELEYIWSVTTLGLTDTVPVTAVNSFSYNTACGSVIIHSDSGTTIGNSGMSEKDFLYWHAVVVEKVDGCFMVTQVNSEMGLSKNEVYASGEGFVLLYHTATLGTEVNVKVGNYVTLSSKFWKTTSAYADGQVYGTVTFSAEKPAQLKEEKDNTGKLDIVQGADTSELIEVNLYDYSSNINMLYKSSTNYPGFQQDNGTVTLNSNSSFGSSSFNFGNNITSDLAAGIESLTNKGGTINQTASSYGGITYGTANIPIEGAMNPVLTDGYPALADGTSLSYLFSNSAYATQKNTASINGLFQYNATNGAYTFNSRENHAQFNAADNTFTLYKQIISSNFMMYPFGNFLPFNDITKLSAQASTIDRSYLQTIAKNAEYKDAQGYGDEYGTLATQLNTFISMMDNMYGSEWDSYDAVNQYFSTIGLGKTFSETSPTLDDGTALMDNIYSIDYDEPTDFFFGMEIKMNFYQPKNGKTGPSYDQDMIFYFTGDDDVWIYLDGALFLDLSGIHRHVGGKIDFVEGKIYYYNLDTTIGDVASSPYKTVTFEEAFRAAYAEGSEELTAALDSLNEKGTFKDYSTHAFNFYYIERGAGSGVCRMNFNFPVLRHNSIQVEKELDKDSDVTILGDPDYPFQIIQAGEDGNEVEDLFIAPGTPYTLYDSDGSVIQEIKLTHNPDGSVKSISVMDRNGDDIDSEDWKTTDSNGVFYLKVGQRAEFVGIDLNAGQYYVRELLDETTWPQYGQIIVSGQAVTQNQDKIVINNESFTGIDSPVKDAANSATTFCFTNTATTSKLGKLSIRKVVEGTASNATFNFIVRLDGEPLPEGTAYFVMKDSKQLRSGASTLDADGNSLITIAGGETAVIGNILAGSKFEVRETSDSAEGYLVSYAPGEGSDVSVTDSAAIGTVKSATSVTIIVTNTEKGIQVPISGMKSLLNPDETIHTYEFQLHQVTVVTNASGQITGFTRQTAVPVQVASAAVSGSEADACAFTFTLNYAQTRLDEQVAEYPVTYYYGITEADANDSRGNSTVYIVAVTISKVSGELSATTQMWCGEAASTADLTTTLTDPAVNVENTSADFENILVDELTVNKKVVGDSAAQAQTYEFTLMLTAGEVPLNASYPAIVTIYNNDGTVKETQAMIVDVLDGKITFTLTHNQSITISDLPYGTAWQIIESASDCKITHVVNGGESIEGDAAAGTITMGGNAVAYTNTVIYELPETGGVGIIPYTMAGVLLLCSAAYLLYRINQRKRGDCTF